MSAPSQPGARAAARGGERCQLLLIAKEPVPGHVKTRLSPLCTPEESARIASAALADTLDALRGTPCRRRVAAVTGTLRPAGFDTVPQRGEGLGERLANAFNDTGCGPTFLVGMDTPQLTAGLLQRSLRELAYVDVVLGPAADGGWWGLGVQHPSYARVLADLPMSTSNTCAATLAALREQGRTVGLLHTLSDVDTYADAVAVAALAPYGRFAAAVAAVGQEIDHREQGSA